MQLPPHEPGVVIKVVNHFLQDDREAAMMVDTAYRYGSDTKHQSSGDVPQEEEVAEITNVFNREGSFMELVKKFDGTRVKVAKFQAHGDQKAFAQKELQLGSFLTILFYPKHSSRAMKYASESILLNFDMKD
ncbi:hypothetical protein POM88_002543 [Heracleum sosnowskyi]|uniref:Uncharacterized protein n=1 Tax=Heracleum sosnowskyi TaxID=360622 RepID=A0AAD8JFQ2_9APIA|nr:hypothetical protein POM88_002543 [Heracleum sosnowskyi]